MKNSTLRTRARRTKLHVETLEGRETPAGVLTFTDVDGDDVRIVTSKGTNADLIGAATFGGVTFQQLQVLDLSASVFAGTSVSITAKRNPAVGGDGRVNVGRIDATGRDLGVVLVIGDLGKILAGDNGSPAPAIGNLNVHSIGRFGTTTQGGGDLNSATVGAIASMTVHSDVLDANIFADGGITALKVGGSLIGGAANDSGQIRSTTIGRATIAGSIVGGVGARSGRLTASLGINAVVIGGSVVGGAGEQSGRIDTTGALNGDLGPVIIRGDLRGGAGNRSGVVAAFRDLRGITIRGSVYGGSGNYDFDPEFGQISALRDIGAIVISGNLIGGSSIYSGTINAHASIRSFTLGGSMLGGSGTGSASIYAVDVLGPVRVGRDVVGDGTDSANIVSTGFTTSVTIAGSLIGGGDNSALIQSNDVLGPVRIGRDLIGGSGQDSAEIYSPTEVKSVTIGGSVVGGGSLYAGTVFSDGPMGPVFVGGNLRGGVGTQSGSIEAVGNLAGVTIGGSVLSGGGALSGSIMSDATLQRVLIRGNVVGTDAVDVQISGRGTIDNFVAIGSLTILGSAEYVNVLGGYDGATPVFGDARIGTIIVIGDWIAGNIVAGVSAGVDLMFGTPDDVLIAGATTAIASIKSIFIKGQVIGTTAGADHFGFVAEQVGILKIGTVTYPFTAAGIEIEDLGATGDFIAREDV